MRVIYIGQTDCESGKDLMVCDINAVANEELAHAGLDRLDKSHLVIKDRGQVICAFDDKTGKVFMSRVAHGKYETYECPRCHERTQGSYRGFIIDSFGAKRGLCPTCKSRK